MVLLRAINKKTIGQVINLGTGYEFSIKDVINFASELLNKKIKVKKNNERFRPKKVKFQDFFQITKKQKKILKWKPKYIGKKGFKEGLRIMLDWVKDQKNNKVNLFND